MKRRASPFSALGALLIAAGLSCGTSASIGETTGQAGAGGPGSGTGGGASTGTTSGSTSTSGTGGASSTSTSSTSTSSTTTPSTTSSSGPTERVVDGATGDDGNPGTPAAPLRTIGRCAALAQPGDTCTVRGGVYRETVAPAQSGAAGAPITFQPHAGEKVTIDCTDAVPAAAWKAEGGARWAAKVSAASAQRHYEPQVFVGDVMAIEARWPDLAGPEQLLDGHVEATAGAGTSASAAGGSLKTGLPPGCGASDLVGATVRVRGGYAWWAHSGTITNATADTLTYASSTASYAGFYTLVGPIAGSRFHVTGARCLLDATNEWHYDEPTTTLRLVAASAPGDAVSVKMRDWAFDLTDRSHVTVTGFDLFACGVRTGDAFAPDATSTVTGVLLDHLHARYLSHFVRVLSPWGSGHMDTGVVLTGHGNTLQHSVLDWSAGNGVALLGHGNTVDDNSITHTDYGAIYTAPVASQAVGGDGSGHAITHNTLAYAGRDGINVTGMGSGWQNGRIAFNEIVGYGMLASDLGGIYLSGQDGTGTHIDHNRVHDSVGGGPALYFDMASKSFTVHHNVVWNAFGPCIHLWGFDGNGDVGCPGMTFNNNTCGPNNGGVSLSVAHMGSLAGTYFSNNIFLEATQDDKGNVMCWSAGGCPAGAATCPAYGSGGSCNYTTKPSPGFRDEASWCDYHLAGGSPAIDTGSAMWTDTAPVDNAITGGTDFGAYEAGGLDWTPGPVCAGTGYSG